MKCRRKRKPRPSSLRTRLEVRCSLDDRKTIERAARLANERTASSWVRRVCLNAAREESRKAKRREASARAVH